MSWQKATIPNSTKNFAMPLSAGIEAGEIYEGADEE